MSQRMLQLLEVFKKPQGFEKSEAGHEVIEVSVPATTAGTFYEKVRTAIDYQEEHLLRRNAILRIVKRYLGSDIPLEDMAENLLREMIWAKYLPNQEVPVALVEKIKPVIMKYEPMLRATETSINDKEWIFQWVLDVMSTEIEYTIAPPVGDEALVSYMYEEMKKRTLWDKDLPLSDEEKDLFFYVACHQTLLKSNLATLRYRVMTLYYPDWQGMTSEDSIEKIAKNLDLVVETVEKVITHPVVARLSLMLRRKASVFWVVRGVMEENMDDFVNLIEDPEKMDKAVTRSLKKRTKWFRTRLQRTVVRSVMFLFITKMLLALIIEVPYDFLVLDDVTFLPLGINILFHPSFLAFISLTVSIPERQNTKDHRSAVRALIVGADSDDLNLHMKRETFSAWSKIFDVFYGITFIFTYSVIATILFNIGFSWLSVTLFLFFLSLVTFFGIRIRTSTKEVVLSPSRSSLPGTIFDIFMLPLVRAGRWLSLKVSKINVFIYFFDFIIEAPYKVAVRFIESWISFVREKKEEI